MPKVEDEELKAYLRLMAGGMPVGVAGALIEGDSDLDDELESMFRKTDPHAALPLACQPAQRSQLHNVGACCRVCPTTTTQNWRSDL